MRGRCNKLISQPSVKNIKTSSLKKNRTNKGLPNKSKEVMNKSFNFTVF